MSNIEIDKVSALEIYKACLNHTLKLVGLGVLVVFLLLSVFSLYIWKSFETVPQTIEATQNNSSGNNSITQGD